MAEKPLFTKLFDVSVNMLLSCKGLLIQAKSSVMKEIPQSGQSCMDLSIVLFSLLITSLGLFTRPWPQAQNVIQRQWTGSTSGDNLTPSKFKFSLLKWN